MRVCAIDLKSNEANICLLDLNQGLFNVPDCRARKFTLQDPTDAEQLAQLQKQVIKLIEDYKIEKLIIKERPMKGKFSGSAASFKIEAALQLIQQVPTQIMSNTEIKQSLKQNPPQASAKELGLKQFQEQAFETAYAYLNQYVSQ